MFGKKIWASVAVLIVATVVIGAGIFIHQEKNSALENSDLKVTSWKLSFFFGPCAPGSISSSLAEGEVTVVNEGERPFYVTKLLAFVENKSDDGVPYSPGPDGKHLFSVKERDGIVEDLSKGEIAAELEEAFENAGYPLSEDVSVSVLIEQDRWCLKDRSNGHSYQIVEIERTGDPDLYKIYKMADESKRIPVGPGEEKSIRMYFVDYTGPGFINDVGSYRYDFGFGGKVENVSRDMKVRIDLKLIAKTPENENLVATETGTVQPLGRRSLQSVDSKSESPENENFPSLCGTCGVPENVRSPPEVITWLGEKRIFFFATDINWGENWEEIEVAKIMVENNRNVRLLGENRPFHTFALLQNEVWGRNSNRFRLSVNGRRLLTPPDKLFLDAPVDRFVRRENVKMRIRLVGSRVRHPAPSEIYYEKRFPQELENVKVENWDSLDAFIVETIPPSLSTAREYTATIKNYRDEPVKVELHVGLYGKFQVREGSHKFRKQWWFDHSFGHYHEENQVILRPGERRTVTFTLIPDSRHSYHFDPSSDVRAKVKVTGVGCESGKAGTIANRSRILVEGKD